MGTITLKGKNIETVGKLPETGKPAPDFCVVKGNLAETTLNDYQGKYLILNIFPSLDTDLCAVSVRKFNQTASDLQDTAVLCISADLPFAAARFCTTEGIENVETGSVFRDPSFGEKYGVKMKTGILKGLLSRAVVVIDKEGKVIFTQQVPEIGEEPDYDAAIAAVKSGK